MGVAPPGHRRQYDFFSVTSSSRRYALHEQVPSVQRDGQQRLRVLVGTKGSTNCADSIFNHDGPSRSWCPRKRRPSPTAGAHRLRDHHRLSQPLNTADANAFSTMAHLGTQTAYSGADKTWQDGGFTEIGPAEYKTRQNGHQAVIRLPEGPLRRNRRHRERSNNSILRGMEC